MVGVGFFQTGLANAGSLLLASSQASFQPPADFDDLYVRAQTQQQIVSDAFSAQQRHTPQVRSIIMRAHNNLLALCKSDVAMDDDQQMVFCLLRDWFKSVHEIVRLLNKKSISIDDAAIRFGQLKVFPEYELVEVIDVEDIDIVEVIGAEDLSVTRPGILIDKVVDLRQGQAVGIDRPTFLKSLLQEVLPVEIESLGKGRRLILLLNQSKPELQQLGVDFWMGLRKSYSVARHLSGRTIVVRNPQIHREVIIEFGSDLRVSFPRPQAVPNDERSV